MKKEEQNKNEKEKEIKEMKQPMKKAESAQGHIKIFDPESGEVFVNKRNAIHYENMSEALALCPANKTNGSFMKCTLVMVVLVLTQQVLSILSPNNTGQSANLYNPNLL